ncbi:hypothetical protein V3C99_019151 [Haemonchus contortus]|uniref:Uncharacterized protein n=1 Tax=Haemonchus contortus TaxID=6289 RepID=A0A7I4Z113_HAECO
MSQKMKILVFTLLLCASAKKHKSSSEEEETTTSAGEKMVDRLAVNLAGAFVKSMFPEIDRQEKKAPEVRRAPVSPLQPTLDNYSPMQVAQDYNAIPQMIQSGGQNTGVYPPQTQSYYPSLQQSSGSSQLMSSNGIGNVLGSGLGSGMGSGMSQTGLNVPAMPLLLSGENGTPEAINALRNQQYLAQLARHQSELTRYNAKQLEYLDQQRRYQQSMIDHQAGAALLMQKQQQDIINEQLKQVQSSFGQSDSLGNDNTVGGRVLTARAKGVKMHEPNAPKRRLTDDDIITNDQHLREYFKEKYGIELPAEASELTSEERETLRALKKVLSENKESAIDKGVFKTMDSFRSKMRSPQSHHRSASKQTSSKSSNPGSCPQCIPHNITMMRGGWTQMYGNPNVIRQTFGAIMSLESARSTNGKMTFSSKKTACVGLEIGHYYKGSAELNMYYRDDAEGNELHEMYGSVTSLEDNIFQMDTDKYHTDMCLVKSGPAEESRYEYMVFAETSGKNACRSYHAFARNTDEFNRRFFDDVSEFMKTELEISSILPVGAFQRASLCQLDRP